MSKKNNFTKRFTRPEDASLVLSGNVVDLAAAQAVHQIDAADDRRWLAEHPEADERHRPATEREIKAYGLPHGCTVIVKRGPLGSQIRMIIHPK